MIFWWGVEGFESLRDPEVVHVDARCLTFQQSG